MADLLRDPGGVQVVAVNSAHDEANRQLLADTVPFPVVQDSGILNIWTFLGGSSSDLYVYDKCGRLTHHVPFPLSLSQPTVLLALQATLQGDLCGPCPQPMWDLTDNIQETVLQSTNDSQLPLVEDFSDLEEDPNKNNTSANKSTSKDNSTPTYTSTPKYTTTPEYKTTSKYTTTPEYKTTSKYTTTPEYKTTSKYTTTTEYTTTPKHTTTSDYTTKDPRTPTFDTTTPPNAEDSVPLDNFFNYYLSSPSNQSQPSSASTTEAVPQPDRRICKKWTLKYLRLAHRCCEASRQAPECGGFSAERCAEVMPAVECCLRHSPEHKRRHPHSHRGHRTGA